MKMEDNFSSDDDIFNFLPPISSANGVGGAGCDIRDELEDFVEEAFSDWTSVKPDYDAITIKVSRATVELSNFQFNFSFEGCAAQRLYWRFSSSVHGFDYRQSKILSLWCCLWT